MEQKKVSAEMAKLALEALEDKKAEDIRIIDISTVSVLADYFIIANGTNRSGQRSGEARQGRTYLQADGRIPDCELGASGFRRRDCTYL